MNEDIPSQMEDGIIDVSESFPECQIFYRIGYGDAAQLCQPAVRQQRGTSETHQKRLLKLFQQAFFNLLWKYTRGKMRPLWQKIGPAMVSAMNYPSNPLG